MPQDVLGPFQGTLVVAALAGGIVGAGYLTRNEATGVEGVVRYAGEPPERKPIHIPANRVAEGRFHIILPETMIVDPATRGIHNAVVYLTPANHKWQKHSSTSRAPGLQPPIIIVWTECSFVPHVAIVPIGATVEFHNMDPWVHNLNISAAKNPAGNWVRQPKQPPIKWIPTSPENVRVNCDFHPWERAYLIVKDPPYAAVTDAQGRFRIEGVPPGDYVAKAWHETLGIQLKEGLHVRVDEGRMTPLAFPPLRPR